MGITERDVLENLDPYVTGATVDKYIYAKPEIKLSPSICTYNGEVRKPEVTVRVNGKELKESEYELTWSEGCKDPGTYQVTAFLRKGLLAGAGIAEFIIREDDKQIDALPPMADVIKTTTINKRPTNVKVSAKGGKVTVRLPKIKRKALLRKIKNTEVQYSMNRSFRNARTRKIGKRKTRAVLRLQKNTTYYIRVRYRGKDGGVSHWSKVKRVRTR